MLITSTANSKYKYLKSLYKDKRLRQSEGVFVCEGVNFVKDIPTQRVVEFFIKESEYNKLAYLESKFGEATIIKDTLFDAVADTVTPSGVIAIVYMELPITVLTANRVLLLCGIMDSGNLGTIIRTASACGIKDIILFDCADAYAPKAVRASMGGILYSNCIMVKSDNVFDILDGYDIIALDMGGKSIYSYERKGKIAIAVGSEAHGLPTEIRERSTEILSLPMAKDSVESLNAAVSISIAMYLIK